MLLSLYKKHKQATHKNTSNEAMAAKKHLTVCQLKTSLNMFLEYFFLFFTIF